MCIYIYMYIYIYVYIIYIYTITSAIYLPWPQKIPRSWTTTQLTMTHSNSIPSLDSNDRFPEWWIHSSGKRKNRLQHTSTKFIWLVVRTPLKDISQLGWLVPIYGKIKLMFQTTNQSSNFNYMNFPGPISFGPFQGMISRQPNARRVILEMV